MGMVCPGLSIIGSRSRDKVTTGYATEDAVFLGQLSLAGICSSLSSRPSSLLPSPKLL